MHNPRRGDVMPTYFKPLRRKIGVITLVMACVFAAGWVRSLVIADQFKISFRRSPLNICDSRDGRLLLRIHIRERDPIPVVNGGATSLMQALGSPSWIAAPVSQLPAMDLSSIKWWWNWLSIGVAAGEIGPQVFLIVMLLPYWFVVTPLILLSAWLLLSKPRVKKSPPNTGSA